MAPSIQNREVRVVAGLGNPGRRYKNTPHNIGFAVIEKIVKKHGGRLRNKHRWQSCACSLDISGQDVLFVEPQTFMNQSGLAVGSIMRAKGVCAESMVVVVDDVNLEMGRMRVRAGGGHGGHRGLESIINQTGTRDFVRIRVGVGNDFEEGKTLTDYVLAPFSGQRKILAEKVVSSAAEAVLCVIVNGVEFAMNDYNGIRIHMKGEENNGFENNA